MKRLIILAALALSVLAVQSRTAPVPSMNGQCLQNCLAEGLDTNSCLRRCANY